ncbi:uncharacterized protein JCM10292_003954 [Rhodotorula paludigena]|uniref:uncharacterized protein n=1 Tax=Rhodotorula paludigena TaxID=86838 RepID=UPI003179E3EF
MALESPLFVLVLEEQADLIETNLYTTAQDGQALAGQLHSLLQAEAPGGVEVQTLVCLVLRSSGGSPARDRFLADFTSSTRLCTTATAFPGPQGATRRFEQLVSCYLPLPSATLYLSPSMVHSLYSCLMRQPAHCMQRIRMASLEDIMSRRPTNAIPTPASAHEGLVRPASSSTALNGLMSHQRAASAQAASAQAASAQAAFESRPNDIGWADSMLPSSLRAVIDPAYPGTPSPPYSPVILERPVNNGTRGFPPIMPISTSSQASTSSSNSLPPPIQEFKPRAMANFNGAVVPKPTPTATFGTGGTPNSLFPPGPLPCIAYYVLPDGCSFSGRCKFSHTYPFTDEQWERFPAYVKRHPCSMRLAGYCLRGDSCPYGHHCSYNSKECPFSSGCVFLQKGLPHADQLEGQQQ